MTAGGLVLEDLDDTSRAQLKLPLSTLALRVKGLGQYGPHGLAKRSGFQKDDILIQVEGLTHRMTEGELLGQLLTSPGGKRALPMRVLRGSRQLDLVLPAP